MEVIHVAPPSKGAFNKHRRVSDLIKAQVGHLKHVEEKLPQAIRDTLPQHQIVTEDNAAQYIAAMTRVLRSGSAISAAPPKPVKEIRPPARIRPRIDISLAASSDLPDRSSRSKIVPKPKKRGSPAKRKT